MAVMLTLDDNGDDEPAAARRRIVGEHSLYVLGIFQKQGA